MAARVAFENELERLHLDLIRMGGMIEEAIEKSIVALKTQDKELANEVIADDKKVDDLERNIETQCLRLLLRQQPVARDLRSISTSLKMITDLERIGDQAADIADISLRFNGKEFVKELVHIPQMAEIAIGMVKDSINAFVHSDMELARDVMKRDDQVDELFYVIKNDLVEILVDKVEQADQVIDFLMIAKYLERIGDHAVNVGEWVIFYMTGEHKDTRIL